MCTALTYLSGDFYMGRTLDYERGYGEEVFEVDVSPFAVDGGRMLAVDTAVVREIITRGETPCASIAKIGEILRVVVSVNDDDIEGHEAVESCDFLEIGCKAHGELHQDSVIQIGNAMRCFEERARRGHVNARGNAICPAF